jgi:hypothetical protein
MFQIYLWIDGESFDSDSFIANLAEDSRGSIELRRRMNGGIVEISGKYWKSVVREITDGPETELTNLVRLYEPAIQKARLNHGCSSIRVMAEIVQEVTSIDSLRGFYFSVEDLSLFVQLGICLDVDIVRKVAMN